MRPNHIYRKLKHCSGGIPDLSLQVFNVLIESVKCQSMWVIVMIPCHDLARARFSVFSLYIHLAFLRTSLCYTSSKVHCVAVACLANRNSNSQGAYQNPARLTTTTTVPDRLPSDILRIPPSPPPPPSPTIHLPTSRTDRHSRLTTTRLFDVPALLPF